jgi:hypothetical protein
MLFSPVMLSEVGAQCDDESKHPGAADFNNADTGSSTETALSPSLKKKERRENSLDLHFLRQHPRDVSASKRGFWRVSPLDMTGFEGIPSWPPSQH